MGTPIPVQNPALRGETRPALLGPVRHEQWTIHGYMRHGGRACFSDFKKGAKRASHPREATIILARPVPSRRSTAATAARATLD